jgi:hypothetical protein
LAKYKGGGFWYPGTIQSVSGGNITIAYDVGDRENLPVSGHDRKTGSSAAELNAS